VKNLIQEDDSTLNYNKWVKGIADKEFGSQRVAVNSLFKNTEDDQQPNSKKHQNTLPFPLPNLISALGNAIVNLSNSISLIETLKSNPIVKHKDNNVHIEESIKNLKNAAEMIQIAAKSVDNITSSI
jgi:hypothetical protein